MTLKVTDALNDIHSYNLWQKFVISHWKNAHPPKCHRHFMCLWFYMHKSFATQIKTPEREADIEKNTHTFLRWNSLACHNVNINRGIFSLWILVYIVRETLSLETIPFSFFVQKLNYFFCICNVFIMHQTKFSIKNIHSNDWIKLAVKCLASWDNLAQVLATKVYELPWYLDENRSKFSSHNQINSFSFTYLFINLFVLMYFSKHVILFI